MRAWSNALEVPTHQWVELRTVFPRNLLTSVAGARQAGGPGLPAILREEHASEAAYASDRRHLADAKRHVGRTLLYLLLLAVGPALALIAVTYVVFGRERGSGYDREYEQQPPDDTQPALVPSPLRQDTGAGSNEFTATLFDLIRRGRYTSKPVTSERTLWAGLRTEQVADILVAPGDTSVPVEPYERAVTEVVDEIVVPDGERLTEFRHRIEGDRAENSKRFERFRKTVASAIRAKRWYANDGAKLLWAAIAACAVAGAVLIALAQNDWRSVAPRWGDVVMVAVGGCLLADAVILFVSSRHVRLWRRRRKAGSSRPSAGRRSAAT